MEFYEEVPAGTNITYYLANDPDNLGSAVRIDPTKIIELDNVQEVVADGKIRSRFDTNHALIDIIINSAVVPETIKFYRNTHQKDILVDKIQSGWRLDNSYYNCIIEVDQDKEINLGINYAYLNGKKVNGIITIPAGQHTFRTHETNWTSATSEESDPLFPYNHKLIIEGLDGSTIYTGVDFLAADELQLISAFDLINNIDTDDRNKYFAIYNYYPLIKIPRPPVELTEAEGWRSEQYAIRYSYPTATTSTEIVLIARMSTINPRYTPVFNGYTISAGY